MLNKKESRQFNISVEGINCEKMYFEHVAKLINNSERSTYNIKISPKKMSPMEYAKRNAYKPVDKKKNNKKIPYIHIQDIEDYYDDYQRNKFFGIIDEMREAEKRFNIIYELGYTNYTFELWMLLHVADMKQQIHGRRAYLEHINRWFNRKYRFIDEYKNENEFKKILDEYVTIDSIKKAIERGDRIVEDNQIARKTVENYKGFAFYRDNPDLSIHMVIKLIFEVCDVQ